LVQYVYSLHLLYMTSGVERKKNSSQVSMR